MGRLSRELRCASVRSHQEQGETGLHYGEKQRSDCDLAANPDQLTTFAAAWQYQRQNHHRQDSEGETVRKEEARKLEHRLELNECGQWTTNRLEVAKSLEVLCIALS